jgi:phenylpropionate dioxygenase-like ring-hydroxylating dioxygenase large terminal subunit
MRETQNFDPKYVSLHQFKTEIWNGFVLVNLDGSAPSFASKNITLTEILSPYRINEMRTIHLGTVDANWDWKLTFENFTEGYHHIGVHPESLKGESPDYMLYPDYDGEHAYFWIGDSGEEQVVSFFPSIEGLPERQATHGLVLTAFPFMHLMMNPDLAVWLQFIPLDAGKHKIEAYGLIPESYTKLPDYEARLDRFKSWIGVIIDEDKAALENASNGISIKYSIPGRYCIYERSIHHFHKWIVARCMEFESR